MGPERRGGGPGIGGSAEEEEGDGRSARDLSGSSGFSPAGLSGSSSLWCRQSPSLRLYPCLPGSIVDPRFHGSIVDPRFRGSTARHRSHGSVVSQSCRGSTAVYPGCRGSTAVYPGCRGSHPGSYCNPGFPGSV